MIGAAGSPRDLTQPRRRSLRLPGKLERQRGLPAARLAVEQRFVLLLTKVA